MSEKIRLCLRLKSGKEFHFSCDKYTITRSKIADELLEFTYEGGFGECPGYFRLSDVESISRINIEEPHYTGCSGCIHYDQQHTALICYDCKRCYKDMYEDGE